MGAAKATKAASTAKPSRTRRTLRAVPATFEPGRTCRHTAERELPDGTRQPYSCIEEWGSDPRFGKCRQCGELLGRTDLAPRARLTFKPKKPKVATPDPQAVWDALIADASAGSN